MEFYNVYYERPSGAPRYLGQFKGHTQAEAINACYAGLDPDMAIINGKYDVDSAGGIGCMFATSVMD